MTSSVIVPKKSRSCAVRVMRQNAATPTPRIALRPTSWPALLAASSGRLAPRCWLVTTAPPVASAPNSVMISWLIISTSDTPEIAASPTDDTITVSAMPTRISSICSMMSGQSSVSSWRLVNSLSFFIFTMHLTFPASSIAQKKPPRNAGDKKASPRGKLSPKVTDAGRACHGFPFTGQRCKLRPHPALRGHLQSSR